MVANIADIRRTTVANWPIERAMLDYWARWIKRDRYSDAPRRPQCNIGKVMDLGMPTGPMRYVDEAVDVDEQAEIVQKFMTDICRRDERIYRALIARHLREIIDRGGNRQRKKREKDLAVGLYGGSISSAVRRLQRDCADGYQRLNFYLDLTRLSC